MFQPSPSKSFACVCAVCWWVCTGLSVCPAVCLSPLPLAGHPPHRSCPPTQASFQLSVGLVGGLGKWGSPTSHDTPLATLPARPLPPPPPPARSGGLVWLGLSCGSCLHVGQQALKDKVCGREVALFAELQHQVCMVPPISVSFQSGRPQCYPPLAQRLLHKSQKANPLLQHFRETRCKALVGQQHSLGPESEGLRWRRLSAAVGGSRAPHESLRSPRPTRMTVLLAGLAPSFIGVIQLLLVSSPSPTIWMHLSGQVAVSLAHISISRVPCDVYRSTVSSCQRAKNYDKCSPRFVQGRNHFECKAPQCIHERWFEPDAGSEGFMRKGWKSHSAVPKVSCGPASPPNVTMGSVAQAWIPESEFCPIKRGGIISRSFELILL